MTVQEIVTAKLGINPCPHVEVAIKEAEQYIKNYCRIEIIPEALNYTWANMVVGLLEGKAKDAAAPGLGPLASVSMGDTSYSFATDRKTAADYMAEVAGDYKAQLNRFRRGLFDSDSSN